MKTTSIESNGVCSPRISIREFKLQVLCPGQKPLSVSVHHSEKSRVARSGLFEAPPPKNWPFLKLVGFEIFKNLLSSRPFSKVYRCLYRQIQKFFFLKTELGIFQLQSPGNPGKVCMVFNQQLQMVDGRHGRKFGGFFIATGAAGWDREVQL